MSEPQDDWEIPEGLTIAQAMAIECLLEGKNYVEAAKVAGVARSTLCGWRRHNDVFQRELEARIAQRHDQLRSGVTWLVPDAVKALREVLQDPNTQATAKVGAARLVLEHAREHLERAAGKLPPSKADELTFDELMEIPELREAMSKIAARQEAERA